MVVYLFNTLARGENTCVELYSKTYQKLSITEKAILRFNEEVHLVIDPVTGNRLARNSTGSTGGHLSDDFMSLMGGNIYLHNHPMGGNFSPDDVAVALGAGSKELRVVTSSRILSIVFENPPAEIFNNAVGAIMFFNAEKSEIGKIFRSQRDNKALNIPTIEAEKRIWLSNYFISELVKRNPWMTYRESVIND